MSNYLFKRLIAMPFLILGIVTMAFALTTITKGDPLTSIVAEQQMNNPEVVAAAKAKWGSIAVCQSAMSSISKPSVWRHGDLVRHEASCQHRLDGPFASHDGAGFIGHGSGIYCRYPAWYSGGLLSRQRD